MNFIEMLFAPALAYPSYHLSSHSKTYETIDPITFDTPTIRQSTPKNISNQWIIGDIITSKIHSTKLQIIQKINDDEFVVKCELRISESKYIWSHPFKINVRKQSLQKIG